MSISRCYSWGELSHKLTPSMVVTAENEMDSHYFGYDDADQQVPLMELLIHHIIKLESRIEELENAKG
ncbi:hypothetical protein RIO-1_23 [Pseudoalteromonas phage RIO-1]|uniref:Uncharacterized protein n=1 Tax=Pseudoalteromonas phage RIO-1 TaxID=1316739 RepID=R4JE15_9CAUD|nr:hypothetical protein RIO-1_23 [Pseudoalteromonas phage RIO-1]AGK87037.1 hypothetical protein RIO-1_23 [Pseudoalteromonas phage RIO-1]